jgi:peptidoglycan/xylan/chitin deacetylase (PgdA/CDA1 family)
VVASIKTASWKILAGLYQVSGLPKLRHRGRVSILTYHRVVSDDMLRQDSIQAGMYVRTPTFDTHLAYLCKHFDVVSLETLLELWRASRLDDGKSYCVITFDDGWRDNYQQAFPLLKKHRIPATIFLATDYVGTARWFWPDQLMFLLEKTREKINSAAARAAVSAVFEETLGLTPAAGNGIYRRSGSNEMLDHDAVVELCKRAHIETIQRLIERLSRAIEVELPDRRVLLNWDEVREMAAHGVTFGSHSCSHRILTQIALAEARRELAGSWNAMLQEGIKPVPVFCYPNGDYQPDIQALVRETGYLAATCCDPGSEGSEPADPYALKRISLHEDISSSASLFGLALSGLRS